MEIEYSNISSLSNESNEQKTTTTKTNKNEKDKVTYDFGECKICNDKASGIHYGLASCEGCKGFYKRSLEKHKSYKCQNQNNCIIKMNSRNRCRACRFKKCLKLGMSIDGIRMGRIPKAEKLKSTTSDEKEETNVIARASLNKEINALIIFNRNNPINRYSDSTIYFPKEFKLWLNSQLNFLKTIETDKEYNIMTLTPNAFEIIEPLDAFKDIDVFKLPQLNLYNSDQCEIILLSLFKDKVYEIYRRHLKLSVVLNDSRERLQTGDYIDVDDKDVSVVEINYAIGYNISLYNEWLSSYARELPGLNKFDAEDFSTIISNSSLLSIAIHINEFYVENECYQIANKIRLSRSRMNIGFGTFMTTLFFMINHKIRKLNLNDNEISLFYPFSLFSSKVEYIKDKKTFYQFKKIYTKALIYALKINGRDIEFLNGFKEILELITIADITKETFSKCYLPED